MTRQKIKTIIRSIAFLMLVALLFVCANRVLSRKAASGAWNMEVKTNGFYNEPNNHFEVMCFGSSHMYCSFNPLVLFDESGISSYVLSSQQQPANVTYYYIREAQKTQKPKVVLLDMLMFTQDTAKIPDEAVLHEAIDFLKLSPNKLELIRDAVPSAQRKNYYFPFLKYHARWSTLTAQDFAFDYLSQTDLTKGYVHLTDAQPLQLETIKLDPAVPKESIAPKTLEYLDKIVALSKEENFSLLFIVAPYAVKSAQQRQFEALKVYAQKQAIPFLDFNALYKETALDFDNDWYDEGHTNASGAEKVTKYLSSYLTAQYPLTDRRGDKAYFDFEECSRQFSFLAQE